MAREYNEVYGWMPEDIINKLSENDRKRMFIDWVTRKPTKAGYVIVSAVVNSLGEDFTNYLFRQALDTIDASQEMSRENILQAVSNQIDYYATDINLLATAIKYYMNESSEVEDDSDEEEDSCQEKAKQPRDSKGRFTKKQ